VTPIHSFQSLSPTGANPYTALVQGSDGNFYGTASGGGIYGLGTVFQITPAGVLTVIYSFTGGSDGATPRGALVQGANGNFYGTAEYGGTNGDGTIFEITPAGVLTPLYNFTGQPDGATPLADSVQGADGNYYGTTAYGGASGNGTVFRITPSGAYTKLYSFKGKTDGSGPLAPLVQGMDGAFYGTTYGGGNTSLNDGYGYGAIFSISANGVLTPLYAFTDGDDGAQPYSALVQGIDGNFYGTAIRGTTGYGAIFQITPGGAFTVLYDFPSSIDGSVPFGALIQGADTNFYGTTFFGGSNNAGTVFQFTIDGVCTSLYSFPSGSAEASPGTGPFAGLIQGTNGNLYGTTVAGGDGSGTIFTLTTAGAFTSLYSFPSGGDGAYPRAALFQDTNGLLYGTAYDGGTNGDGAIFQITTSGTLAPLYSFTGVADGGNPWGGLVQGSDGDLYGTTGNYSPLLHGSGVSPYGTVFKMTTAGVITTLYSFQNEKDGGCPHAGVIEGIDGNFYGTTIFGSTDYGTIFKMTSAGVVSNLHSFTGGSDGAYPWAALVQGTDTNFYGTAYDGGSGYGTVFKVTSKGAFTLIHEFNGSSGGAPYAPLIQASDGNFYGTTSGENTSGFGTIFKITPPNTFSNLYSFTNGSDGAGPMGGLVQGSDGNFYGTTSAGGPNDTGVVFSLTPGGSLQPLYYFSAVNTYGFNQDGSGPDGALIQATDGSFYGVTEYGGQYGSGTIFRLTVAPAFLSATEAAGTMSFTWSTEAGAIYQLQYCTDLAQINWTCLGNSITATTSTLSACDVAPADTQRFYRVVALP
jgi:uncharacterized repeat protein (TIGR03803 family)